MMQLVILTRDGGHTQESCVPSMWAITLVRHDGSMSNSKQKCQLRDGMAPEVSRQGQLCSPRPRHKETVSGATLPKRSNPT
jgi:hypothetical protein